MANQNEASTAAIITACIVVPAVAAAAWLYHLAHRAGLFCPLSVIERTFGPFVLLYDNVSGPSYSCLPAHVERVARMAVEDARMVQVGWGGMSLTSVVPDLATQSWYKQHGI